MKTFKQFIAEAAKQRLVFTPVYRGDDNADVAREIKKNRNAKVSEYGVYGPGVYASSDINVARHYSGIKNSNVGVTKSRIEKGRYKTIKTPEHNNPEGIQKSRELVFGDRNTSVRIKNAANSQERRSHAVGSKPKSESDYFVINSKTFNKGITTTPILRKRKNTRK